MVGRDATIPARALCPLANIFAAESQLIATGCCCSNLRLFQNRPSRSLFVYCTRLTTVNMKMSPITVTRIKNTVVDKSPRFSK